MTTKNFNNESIIAVMQSVKSIEGLKTANKEVKSLSGAMRIVTTAQNWTAGYSEVFGRFGFNDRKDLTLKSFFAFLHEDLVEEWTSKKGEKFTDIKVWALRDQIAKGADGKPKKGTDGKPLKVLDRKTGKPVREAYLKTCKSFTPTLLAVILAQSAELKK